MVNSGIIDQYGNPLSTASALPDASNTAPAKRFKFRASGYEDYGASHHKPSMRDWRPNSGSPDDDIIWNVETLRERSRDVYGENPVAQAAINTKVNNVIGSGLTPHPKPDPVVLGLNEKDAEELSKEIKDEFGLWADTPDCDWERRFDFYQLQALAYKTLLLSGDVPCLLPLSPRSTCEYDLRVRLIEPDRVCTPMLWNFIPNIVEGVQIDFDTGEVESYHIRQIHPLTRFFTYAQIKHFLEWVEVPAYNEMGRPNMILAFDPDRPGQRRGIPLLAKILEQLKQLDRFMDATVSACVYQSFWAFFIESQMPDAQMLSNLPNSFLSDVYGYDGDDNRVRFREGQVANLKPGDKITFPKVENPGSMFEHFVKFMIKVLSAAIQIPGGILLKEFDSSYSASRAEMLEFGKHVEVQRRLIAKQFCQVIYEQWFFEAVAKGNINIPGFWTDKRIQRAAMRCEWNGAPMGSLDPEKELKALEVGMKLGVITGERAAHEFNGSNWDANIRRQKVEKLMADESDVAYAPNKTPVTVNQRIEDITQDQSSGKPNPKKDADKQTKSN